MKNKKDIILITSMFLGLTILGFGYKFYVSKNKENIESVVNQENRTEKDSSKIEVENSEIFIHIEGEVKNPGIYKMKNGDRVDDAIRKAGGLTENADRSRINLAVKLKDEMKIYILKIGENHSDAVNDSNDNPSIKDKLININTASKDELCKLNGIGESKANLIIEYREKSKFTKIEDIMKVSGIGKKTFEKIKNDITVE